MMSCRRILTKAVVYTLCLVTYIIIFAAFAGSAPANMLDTPFEKSHYISFPSSDEIKEYVDMLAFSYSNATTLPLGYSSGDRPIYALLIASNIDALAQTDSEQTDLESDKLKVLLVGSQHGDEPSGSEALQILARELLTEHTYDYLDSIDLLMIINANPDGRDLNLIRYNAAGVDINRDYELLEQGVSRAIVSVLNQFDPDVVIDVHEAAADKNILTYRQGYLTDFGPQFVTGNNPNINSQLQTFAREVFLPDLIQSMQAQGLKPSIYRGAIAHLEQPILAANPSVDILRNYAGMRGALSILIENDTDPQYMFKDKGDKKAEVDKQKRNIVSVLDKVVQYRDQIKELSKHARHQWQNGFAENSTIWLENDFKPNKAKPTIGIPLLHTSDNEHVKIPFPNYEVVAKKTPIKLPDAYAITAEQDSFKKLLQLHGISFTEVSEQIKLPGKSQQIETINVLAPGNRRQLVAVDVTEKDAEINLQPGDLLVKTQQRQGLLLPLMLDPRSADSLFQKDIYSCLLLKYNQFFIVPVNLPGKSVHNGD